MQRPSLNRVGKIPHPVLNLGFELQQPISTPGVGRMTDESAILLFLLVCRLFRQAIDAAGAGEFVFPGEHSASHIASRSVSKAMERTRTKLGIRDVTMHDLRRTAGTYLSRLGVPKDVRERILNHGGSRKGSITDGVYNHYEYDAEKRAALELWADAINAITGSGPAEIDGYHVRLSRLKGIERITVG